MPFRIAVSKAEPMLMVSAFELSVAILMVFPAVPVPILIVFELLPVPRFNAPVVPESRVRAEEVVEAIVPAPAKVKLVAEVAIVSIEATPVKAPPVVTFSPAFEVNAKVPVAFPIAVFAVPVVLIEAVPPETVIPAEPVNNPADVIVPEPVVEILPEVASVPASLMVNEETPPDWMSNDVLVAPFVSFSTKAVAVPALVMETDVEVTSPEANVKAISLPVVVVIVLPASYELWSVPPPADTQEPETL